VTDPQSGQQTKRVDEYLELADEVKRLRDSYATLQKKLEEKDNVIGNLAVALRRIDVGGSREKSSLAGETQRTPEELSILAAEAFKRLEKSDFWKHHKSLRQALGETVD